ncbi:MAG TPA: electron transfer flavoprotein, partial [Raoultella ornithinolytica]|nr:electron transfer flavoprotein [Raoultella ornithinolytica]
AKADIVRQAATVEATPDVQCRRLTRPAQRRAAVIVEGATVQEKAGALWENYLCRRMRP